jgi:hypothetical protein
MNPAVTSNPFPPSGGILEECPVAVNDEPLSVKPEADFSAPAPIPSDPVPTIDPVIEKPPAPVAGDVASLNTVVLDEKLLFPVDASPVFSGSLPVFITSLTGFDEVRDLGASRFGAVRLIE